MATKAEKEAACEEALAKAIESLFVPAAEAVNAGAADVVAAQKALHGEIEELTAELERLRAAGTPAADLQRYSERLQQAHARLSMVLQKLGDIELRSARLMQALRVKLPAETDIEPLPEQALPTESNDAETTN